MAAAAGALALAAAPAATHIVYGRASLAELVGEADLVARARIEATGGVVDVPGGGRRPVVAAALLEVLVGDAGARRVRFAQHGHGVAAFAPGEEVLLFLVAVEKSRELAALAAPGGPRWVSLQEEGETFVLDDGSRAGRIAAVRAYAALAGIAAPEARLAAWRELTFDLLRSPDPRLSAAALGDLVAASDELVTAATRSRLGALIDDPGVAIGVRLGVLAELDRRGLVTEGAARWARLLRTVAPPDLLAVVRAAGAQPGPAVTRELVRLVAAGDPVLAPAAALALGVPGNDAAVEPLAAALDQEEPRLRMAAIRALGAVATAAARAALEEASRAHPDAPARRRAAAELRRLAAASRPD